MGVRSIRRRSGPLRPDYNNRNPFRGLPAGFPDSHSRFPIVPSAGYGGLSFLPQVDENGSTEERSMTSDDRAAWHDAACEAFGDLVEIPVEPSESERN
jgi:hypothetical protein